MRVCIQGGIVLTNALHVFFGIFLIFHHRLHNNNCIMSIGRCTHFCNKNYRCFLYVYNHEPQLCTYYVSVFSIYVYIKYSTII